MELGFKENEIQHMVIAVPKVLTANKRKLIQIFDYLHNTMKVPHHLITKFPQVGYCITWTISPYNCEYLGFLLSNSRFPAGPKYEVLAHKGAPHVP